MNEQVATEPGRSAETPPEGDEAEFVTKMRAEAQPPTEEDGPPAESPPTEEEEEAAEEEAGGSPEAAAEAEPTPEQKAFLREAERHEKNLRKILGDDVPLVPCPTCEAMGYLPPGQLPPTEFREHEQFKTCDECDGLGQVKTGSQVMGHEARDCPKCQGRGYLEKLPALAPVPSEQQQAEQYGTPAWMGTAPAPTA